MSVLVIDPCSDARKALTSAVKWVDGRHRLEFADDGAAGVAIALKNRPSIVFCERFLPDITGEKLCQHLREYLRATTFVAYTNDAEKLERGVREKNAFHHVLSKPPCRWRTHAILQNARAERRNSEIPSIVNKLRRPRDPVARTINLKVRVINDPLHFVLPMTEGATVSMVVQRLGKQVRYFILTRNSREIAANALTVLHDGDELTFALQERGR